MDINIIDELTKKLQEGKQKEMSLSERLNYLDNYNKDVAVPQISSEGPKGYNPINSLNSLFQLISNRKAVSNDISNQSNTNLDILKTLSSEKEKNIKDPLDAQIKKANLLKTLKDVGMTIGADGKTFTPLTNEDLMSQVDLKGTSKTDMELIRAIDSATTAAQSQYNKGYSGLLDSLLGTARIKTNAKGSDKEAQFRQTVAEVQNTIRNYISGAAVNESEAKFLKGLYPSLTDSDTEIQRKLQGVKDYVARKAQGILDTSNYKIDAGEYLGSTGKKKQDIQSDPLELGL